MSSSGVLIDKLQDVKHVAFLLGHPVFITFIGISDQVS